MSFKSTHGYSPVLPFVFAGLCLGFVAFIIMGIYTQNWVWLLGALACWAGVARK